MDGGKLANDENRPQCEHSVGFPVSSLHYATSGSKKGPSRPLPRMRVLGTKVLAKTSVVQCEKYGQSNSGKSVLQLYLQSGSRQISKYHNLLINNNIFLVSAQF